MSSKTKLITIAGPQSSGKTTIFNLLKENYPQALFLPEINPFTFKKDHLGAAYVTKKFEKQIVEADINQIKNLKHSLYNNRLKNNKKSRPRTVIVETGIFHLVYLDETIVGKKTAEKFLSKYLLALQRFKPLILFIDTKPHVSWQRRKNHYIKRLKKTKSTSGKEKKKFLERHKAKIYRLYPLWLKHYQKLPFKKIIVKNSYKDYSKFISETLSHISYLIL